MSKKAFSVWHALIFGIYPILRLCFYVVDPITPSDCLRDIALMLAVTIILLWLLKPLIPQLTKRAIVVTLFYLLFFNYLKVVLLLSAVPPLTALLDSLLTSPAFALMVLGGLLVPVVYMVRRSNSEFEMITTCANIFATVFLVFALSNAFWPYLTGAHDRWRAAADEIISDNLSQEVRYSGNLPDIYYVILDGYARADVLERLYDFDNSQFLGYLSESGFFVPSQSRSNYSQTYLSLASSLNLTYLDRLQHVVGAEAIDRRPLRYLIENSSVARLLQRAGYQFLFVSSNFSGTRRNPHADIRYSWSSAITDLENKLIFQTPLSKWKPLDQLQYQTHRDKILRTFQQLGDIPDRESPVFVFAHIIAPHPPFVFGPQGEEVLPDAPFSFNDGNHYVGSHAEYVEGYRNQLTYINSKLEEMLDVILSRSTTPPIIVLQADHGPGSALDWFSVEGSDLAERMSIFAAYYVPDEVKHQLYDTVTPVNTFRILFSTYLDAAYPILADRSYFSTWDHPYAFVEVTDNAGAVSH